MAVVRANNPTGLAPRHAASMAAGAPRGAGSRLRSHGSTSLHQHSPDSQTIRHDFGLLPASSAIWFPGEWLDRLEGHGHTVMWAPPLVGLPSSR